MDIESPHGWFTMQCAAKAKQSGEQCKRHAVVGREVCAIHGGKSLASVASPTFKTGRHSKYLPARLQERYAASIADSELLALREDIALLDARLGELLERVDTGGSGQRWSQLTVAWFAFKTATDPIEVIKARLLVDTIIDDAATDYAAWGEVHNILEQRRKLSESEQKRLVTMQQMVTAEQAMLFVAAIQDAVRRHVTDRRVLSAIAADVAALSNRAAA